MKKTELMKVNFNELNEEARRIFETSDQEALFDFFGTCANIEEINKVAKDIIIELDIKEDMHMENTSVLKAIQKLYKELDIDSDVLFDIKHDALTENTAKNGRDVLWYMDEQKNVAIYIDTLQLLTETEIETELAD